MGGATRTRRAATRAQAVILIAVVACAAYACGALGSNGTFGKLTTAARPGAGAGTATGGPVVAHAEQQLIPFRTIPPTTVLGQPLSVPIAIPFDSYAPEPVVEYGTIEIPKIGLVHKTFEGVTLHNIDEGPSHWPGSALPGQRGNAVFAGHRVTHSHPFLRVDELAPGDEVIFTVNGNRSVYRVTESFVVGPDDTWIANQTDAPTATLYACHPPGSAAQRYVVKMALVVAPAESPLS